MSHLEELRNSVAVSYLNKYAESGHQTHTTGLAAILLAEMMARIADELAGLNSHLEKLTGYADNGAQELQVGITDRVIIRKEEVW